MVKNKFLIISNDSKSIVNFRLDLLVEVKNLGYEVNIMSPGIDRSEYSLDLLNHGFKLHDLSINRVSMNPLSESKTLYELYRKIKKIKPDYVLSYTIKPCIYGSIVSKVLGVRNINMLITGLGYIFTEQSKIKKTNKFILNLYKIACSSASNIIFQNNDDASLFFEMKLVSDSSKVSVVNGSGVNCSLFPAMPLKKSENYISNFLMVSRLLKDKGIYEYIEAIRKVKKDFPNIVFGLLGALDDNPLSVSLDELNSWIDEGLIVYHGYSNDVKEIIKQYNVIVLPSYREGVPRSILEGMAMGRAIVTTNAPGCKETVIDGLNGYLVEPKSSHSLYVAFSKLIADPQLIEKMSKESLDLIKHRFDVKLINSEMIKIMDLNHIR